MPGELEPGRQWNSGSLQGVSPKTGHRVVNPARRFARARFALYLRTPMGSDVFGMYQSLVEGREVPWSLLVKDVPPDKHQDLDFIIEQLDWEKNVDPNFKQSNYLEPIEAESGEGWTDRWVVYGTVNGRQLFSAKELTVEPGQRCRLQDRAASGWLTVQGKGRIGTLNLQTPAMIRFGQWTEDEVFISHMAAEEGVEIENTGSEPLVGLRYFGPDAFDQLPAVGDHQSG